jgi:hypothetical protein
MWYKCLKKNIIIIWANISPSVFSTLLKSFNMGKKYNIF